MNGEEVFAEVAHDLRGALGSLRLVMGSLIDEEDREHRVAMLRLADEETQRIAAGLAALPALGLAATDRSAVSPIDLRGALAEARDAAGRLGATVSLGEVAAVSVVSRPAVLALVLPALLVLASGVEGSTEVSAQEADGRVVINCTVGPLWPQARHLVPRLVEAAGGEATTVASGVGLSLPVAT